MMQIATLCEDLAAAADCPVEERRAYISIARKLLGSAERIRASIYGSARR
jgi:hypothetical protein